MQSCGNPEDGPQRHPGVAEGAGQSVQYHRNCERALTSGPLVRTSGTAMEPDRRPHVVIVGAGFAGLEAAKILGRRDDVRVTVVDRRNHHLFQPLLYQVATATLDPSDVASPIRGILRRARNTEVMLAEVTAIDRVGRAVQLADGELGRLRPPHRRHGRAGQLLRPRRLGRVRPGAEEHRGRARGPPPRALRLRGGRARGGRGPAPRLDDLRHHRRRPHRGGAGRFAQRDRPPGASARLPSHRHPRRRASSWSRVWTGCSPPTRSI